MATLTAVQTSWAVLDERGDVVVIFSGADAIEAAGEWQAKGYRVEAIELS